MCRLAGSAITSYLSGRSQLVRRGSSVVLFLSHGVPQGCILGPILSLRDPVGERDSHREASAEELGAAGEVAAEPARRHTIPLKLVEEQ